MNHSHLIKRGTRGISIIIPCFNTRPEYLREAIDSVKQCNLKCSYNIIIVNDGSTKSETIQFLDTLNDAIIEVIPQTNKGLAGAKNTGVKNTASEYIFFLDSDDRVKPGYLSEGLKILEANAKVGVVYANAEPFGDDSRQNFIAKPFDAIELLIQNFIPSCVVMRRKAWEEVGGFDENLRRFEDWECWINIYKAGWKFEFLDKPMFDYRIQQNSLLGTSNDEDFKNAIKYIYQKHWDLVHQIYHKLYARNIIYENDMQRPFRSFIKYSKKKLSG